MESLDEIKLANRVYEAAKETGEVDERDKEAVIIGAIRAIRECNSAPGWGWWSGEDDMF